MSIVLSANKRDALGSSKAKKVRRDGGVTAVLYKSGKESLQFSLPIREVEHAMLKHDLLSLVVCIKFSDLEINAIARTVDRHSVSDRPQHIEFLLCDSDEKVKANPKVVFVNKDKSPGLKRGSFLNMITRRVRVVCDSINSVPEEIVIDASEFLTGSRIKSCDVSLPEGVSFFEKDEFLIATVIGRGKAETPGVQAAAEAKK